jgi:mRNA interferase RelE/StbE
MASDGDGWDWALSPRAEEQFSRLDSDARERIVSKLDEVVTSQWRSPDEFLESLSGSPFEKLRVGGYRLGCRTVEETETPRVESVRKREGAYSGDD